MFKVGDKVKINCTDRWYSALGKFKSNGQTYTIIKIKKPRWPNDEFIYVLDSLSFYLWSEKELKLMKPKFDVKNYPSKCVMYCKTKEQDKTFREYLHIVGKRWGSGDKYIDKSHITDKSGICHNFNNGCYDDYEYYLNEGFCILNFNDFDWSDFEMKKEFTRNDLKNGDVVKFRCGDIGIVIYDIGSILVYDQHNSQPSTYLLSDRGDDLTSILCSRNDIMAVRRPRRAEDCSFYAFEMRYGELVYERKEVEEMTLEEVCKALGKEIKIVKK